MVGLAKASFLTTLDSLFLSFLLPSSFVKSSRRYTPRLFSNKESHSEPIPFLSSLT
jgi:hypothetical protein